jgi:hypothetical protein
VPTGGEGTEGAANLGKHDLELVAAQGFESRLVFQRTPAHTDGERCSRVLPHNASCQYVEQDAVFATLSNKAKSEQRVVEALVETSQTDVELASGNRHPKTIKCQLPKSLTIMTWYGLRMNHVSMLDELRVQSVSSVRRHSAVPQPLRRLC